MHEGFGPGGARPCEAGADGDLVDAESFDRRGEPVDDVVQLGFGQLECRPHIEVYFVHLEATFRRPSRLAGAHHGQSLAELSFEAQQSDRSAVVVMHRRDVAHLGQGECALIALVVVGDADEQVHVLDGWQPRQAEVLQTLDRAARAIVDEHGVDSLSPFVLRPDKALLFAAGGILSYRVIRGTAIVSADPVAPGDRAPQVLASLLGLARSRGWHVAVWGAAERHLAAYRRLGLRAVRVGEEAFVDPAKFTLEGRAVRKLRQSVHRVQRRGWEIVVRDGRAIDPELETEIDALEQTWRARADA